MKWRRSSGTQSKPYSAFNIHRVETRRRQIYLPFDSKVFQRVWYYAMEHSSNTDRHLYRRSKGLHAQAIWAPKLSHSPVLRIDFITVLFVLLVRAEVG